MRFLTLLFSCLALSGFGQLTNWYDEEAEVNGYFSISTDKAYSELLRGQTPKEVIVAIIDSGIDADHEDLKDVMWVNEGEIPGNGTDDDGNGYIDDMHGWNFLGNAEGENVNQDTYEMTRLYAQYREKYGEMTSDSDLSEKEKKEFGQYKEWGEKIKKERSNAKSKLDEFDRTEKYLLDVVSSLDDHLSQDTLTTETLEELKLSGNAQLIVGANIVESVSEQYGKIPTLSELKRDIGFQFSMMRKDPIAKYYYQYNPDFDSRVIVNDNYDNLNERYYGNNDVEGPDAFHGTHVAGIVAAQRDNNIGTNGIAGNVRIMSVRAVPDGDEHDKDVANAIIYAVDNGAKVINMSFGKGYSPEKEVVDKAVRYAEKNDVLLVHAAGNGSTNNDVTPNFPNDTYKKGFGFLFFKKKQPKNWLEVGALSNARDANLVAPFSNYGKNEIDLFSPGMFMLAPVPNNGYQVLQGTSMAAPVVTGIAAVLRGYFPNLKAKEIKSILINSSLRSDKEVVVPGTNRKKLPFSELSVSGGAVNLYSAIKYAKRTYDSKAKSGSGNRGKENKKKKKGKPNIAP